MFIYYKNKSVLIFAFYVVGHDVLMLQLLLINVMMSTHLVSL